MFSPNRLLTPKEQALLLGVALAVLVGSVAIYWSARRDAPDAVAEVGVKAPPAAPPARPAPTAEPKGAVVAKPEMVSPGTTPIPAPALDPPIAAPAPPPSPPPAATVEIAVAVRGGVRHEGLFRLPTDSRVADLVMKAGGATADADLSEINLAARLMDGTTLTVPVGARIVEEDGRIQGRGGQYHAAANPTAYLAGTGAPEATGPTPGRVGTTAQAPVDTGTPAPNTLKAPTTGNGLVNLNTASQAELETLPGIGPALAGRILEYRASRPFSSVDELDNVPGIGEKRLEAVRSLVTAQ